MTELDAMLAAIIADPCEDTLWLALADFLEERDEPLRAELIRLHRKLLATCCEPEAHPERVAWQSRMVELLAQGVEPCVPRKTLMLPGDVPMTFAFVPPGSFLMGGTLNERAKPVHKVVLTKGFFLGIYPVTQAQWKVVMGSAPSHFKGPNRPVESVSWDECQEFCSSLTAEVPGPGWIELPSESEWEYACRAGTRSEYHFGDIITTDLANYDGNDSWGGSPKGKYREATTDVDLFPPNAWGLHDMHGNVYEWCQDWYGAYLPAEQPQRQSSGGYRVMRGGNWNFGPGYCSSVDRCKGDPSQRGLRVGFRVCLRPA